MPEPVARKLAAILAADIAGFSRLAGADEERTLARMRALRSDLIDPVIAIHNGRVVKRTGDGALVEFRSVVDAVRCAVEVQSGMAERNAGLPSERKIEFRVGVHLGDVMEESDGDLMGDGVNIAARLEGIAAPGTIVLSEDAWRQVRDKLPHGFADLGEQALKNIARPVRAYRVDPAAHAADAEQARAALELADKPSIAVLPFQNMSGDPDQEYFCDGMVEDIVTGLSRIRWLDVIARNSSFVYKGKSIDVKQVGRELGVRYVLEGSVRKAGGRLRITGQLIEAQSGAHLWADRYDGAVDDVFALQDEITLAVGGAIEPSLRAAEIERVKRKRPDSLDAYDIVLRAWPLLYSRMPADAAKAIPLFEQALALDPGYGLAHAAVAWCYHARFYRGGGNPQDDEAAVRHAKAAAAHGADDATALGIAAFVLSTAVQRDRKAALSLFDRALALSPSCTIALGYGSAILAAAGDTKKAIERAKLALRLSPFDPFRYTGHAGLSYAYFVEARYDEAAEEARRAIETNPRFSFLHAQLAAALANLGRIDEAKAVVQQILALQPNFAIHTLAVELDVAGGAGAAFLGELRAAGAPD